MALSWSRLAPHRPLGPGDPLYIERPLGGGDELAARLLTGDTDVVAVVGPAGSGKSTELVRTAFLLQPHFVVVQVPLDRLVEMRKVTEREACLHMARRIEEVARTDLGIEISPASKQQLHASPQEMPARDLLVRVMREVTRASSQGTLALFLDGLEKSDGDAAARIVRALLDLRDEARLVFVAPYSVVVGSGGYDLQASGAHFHFVRAVPVRSDQAPEASAGRQFLYTIADARLGSDPLAAIGLHPVLVRAAQWSGGLPRSFLQLVQAAGRNAALHGRDVPTLEDVEAAAQDHAEGLARLLERGDVERLRDADGKSDREIDTNDRVRLLTQGLLLDYKTSQQGAVVHPAPLLGGLLARAADPEVEPAPASTTPREK